MVWLVVTLICAFYTFGWLFAPFPYWPTYVLLWKHVLLDPEKSIPLRSRARQAFFLLPYLIVSPFWTLLWYLDEILFPAYRQGQHRSLFIIGEPRSGTTFLHRTLATDEETFFAVRHIEWRYPYITLQKLFQWLQLDNWLKNQNYWPDNEVGRKASKMHKDTLYDWEEDGIFFEECFLHHLFIWHRIPFPALISYLDDFTQLPESVQHHMMRTYQKVIQKVMYLRGGVNKIYLSKEVAGQRKLQRVIEYYPEARFMFVARPSNAYLNSILALAKASTTVKTGIDPYQIPGWEAAFIERMRVDYVILLDFLSRNSPEEQICLSFDLLLQQLVLSIQVVYAKFDLPLSPAYRHYLETVQQQQKSRKRGYDYSLQTIQGFERYDAFVAEVMQQHQAMLDSNMQN